MESLNNTSRLYKEENVVSTIEMMQKWNPTMLMRVSVAGLA
jgi:hypothetical protein